jgi:hypothetical protein
MEFDLPVPVNTINVLTKTSLSDITELAKKQGTLFIYVADK